MDKTVTNDISLPQNGKNYYFSKVCVLKWFALKDIELKVLDSNPNEEEKKINLTNIYECCQ